MPPRRPRQTGQKTREAKARTVDHLGSWSSSAKRLLEGQVRSAAAVYTRPRARVFLFRAKNLRSRAKNRARRIPWSPGHHDELKMEQTGSHSEPPVILAVALNALPLKVESCPRPCRAAGATIGIGSGSFRSIS